MTNVQQLNTHRPGPWPRIPAGVPVGALLEWLMDDADRARAEG